ncbi:MAG: prolipoprotein diacylglyceryl transferase [Planctomycetota bacterium]|jgi:phosphatidylglycerol:prolipoprotein diacylglycerol transferase
MYPELFEIPFIGMSLRTYGLMMVLGFTAAVTLMKRLGRGIRPDCPFITNLALYCLVAGVVGARLFFIVHHSDSFHGRPLDVFAIWEGGLEFLGGMILAVAVILFYLSYHKLPIRRCLDVLAIGLMLGLSFGRIGCFLAGDCYGRPTDLPWAVRFPYGSLVYVSQINADLERNRPEPHLDLPREEDLAYTAENGMLYPKAYEDLTDAQKHEVTEGKYRCLPSHPTQLYSSACAALLCLILYLFWRRSQVAPGKFFAQPGSTFALAFVLYGVVRFLIEYLRDDNPLEHASWIMRVIYNVYKGGTVAQTLSIYMIILGVVFLTVFQKTKPASIRAAGGASDKSDGPTA